MNSDNSIFVCCQCGEELEITISDIGQVITCPGCGSKYTPWIDLEPVEDEEDD